jgi:hypothetical protein
MNATTTHCVLVQFGTDKFYSTNLIELSNNYCNSKLNTRRFNEIMYLDAVIVILITLKSC